MGFGVVVALLSVNLHLVLAQGAVDYVGTPAAFQAAAQAGVRHIILNNHMDLRSLPADPLSSLDSTLIINSSTKSIRVRPQACTQRSWTAHQHAITARALSYSHKKENFGNIISSTGRDSMCLQAQAISLGHPVETSCGPAKQVGMYTITSEHIQTNLFILSSVL